MSLDNFYIFLWYSCDIIWITLIALDFEWIRIVYKNSLSFITITIVLIHDTWWINWWLLKSDIMRGTCIENRQLISSMIYHWINLIGTSLIYIQIWLENCCGVAYFYSLLYFKIDIIQLFITTRLKIGWSQAEEYKWNKTKI